MSCKQLTYAKRNTNIDSSDFPKTDLDTRTGVITEQLAETMQVIFMSFQHDTKKTF